MRRILFLLTALLVMRLAGYGEAMSSCSVAALPTGISNILTSQFPGWRIATLENLESYDRDLWIKSKPGKCPGITAGHFFNAHMKSFAVLLVPEDAHGKGYKVIAFKPIDGKGNVKPVAVEESGTENASDVVIYRLPPGVFEDPDRTRRVRVQLDALQVEKMEVSTKLYFWQAGRFERLITSN